MITDEELAEVRRVYADHVATVELPMLAALGITRDMLAELHVLGRRDWKAGWARAVEMGMPIEKYGLGGPIGEPGARWQRTIDVVGFDDFVHLVLVEPEDEPS